MSDRGSATRLRPVSDLALYLHEVLDVEVDVALLERALVHRSYAYENGGLPHNERLEFLGDSVLSLVVTNHLYCTHPDLSEGRLAKLRAAVVNMRALAQVARTIDLGEYVLLGRGENSTGGRDKDSILADTTEALIGAVYLSDGIETAGELVHHLLDPIMAASAEMGAGLDWKTSLQELTSERALGQPSYEVIDSGPEHAKEFAATAIVAGEPLGHGSGRTKKDAESAAAEQAWRAINASDGAAPTSRA